MPRSSSARATVSARVRLNSMLRLSVPGAVGVTVYLYPDLPVVCIRGMPQSVDLFLDGVEKGGLIDAELRRIQVKANHLPLQQRLVGLQLPRSLEMWIERKIRLPLCGDFLRRHIELGSNDCGSAASGSRRPLTEYPNQRCCAPMTTIPGSLCSRPTYPAHRRLSRIAGP